MLTWKEALVQDQQHRPWPEDALALGGILSLFLDFLFSLGLAVFASLMIIVLIELAKDRADRKRH